MRYPLIIILKELATFDTRKKLFLWLEKKKKKMKHQDMKKGKYKMKMMRLRQVMNVLCNCKVETVTKIT